jgi:hypothetical protein
VYGATFARVNKISSALKKYQSKLKEEDEARLIEREIKNDYSDYHPNNPKYGILGKKEKKMFKCFKVIQV